MTRARPALAALALWLAGCTVPFDLTRAKSPTEPGNVEADTSDEVPASANERWWGPKSAEEFKKTKPAYGDAKLDAYLTEVLDRLMPHARRPGLSFRVEAIDSPEAQAWALLGGRVFVARGALALMESEAELAAVLAHEIGHTASQQGLYAMWQSALSIEEAAGEPEARAEAYRWDHEFQADRLGLVYLRAAGYDPQAMARILARLFAWPRAEGVDEAAGTRRLARIARHEGSLPWGELGRDRYLDHVDGLVYGDDPRGGVMRGRTYTCSRCELSFDLPAGFVVETATPRLVAHDRTATTSVSFQRVDATHGAPFADDPASGKAQAARGTKDGPEETKVLTGRGEIYALTSKGPASKAVVAAILRTVRHLDAAAEGPRPRRVSVRRVKERGRFTDALAAACADGVEKLGVVASLNGVSPLEVVDAGRRFKCITR